MSAVPEHQLKLSLSGAFEKWARKDYDEYSREDVIAAVKAERPDLANATFYTPCYGEISHVVMTADEVFKAPKRTDQIEALQAECETQNLLSASGLKVPEITCLGRDFSFYGMKRMRGKELTTFSGMTKWDDGQLDALAKDLAAFFYGVATALPVHIPAESPQPIKPKFGRISQVLQDDLLRKALGDDDYAFCKQQINEFEERIKDRRPVMIHADVHMSNILIDPDTRRLDTVLDFGQMKPAYPEFSGFFSTTVIDRLSEKVWAEYARLNPEVDIRDQKCYDICCKLNYVAMGATEQAFSFYAPMIAKPLLHLREMMGVPSSSASAPAVSPQGPSHDR